MKSGERKMLKDLSREILLYVERNMPQTGPTNRDLLVLRSAAWAVDSMSIPNYDYFTREKENMIRAMDIEELNHAGL